VKEVEWEKRIFQVSMPQLVFRFIDFGLEFVCFLCSCFSLSTFHQQALFVDLRYEDV